MLVMDMSRVKAALVISAAMLVRVLVADDGGEVFVPAGRDAVHGGTATLNLPVGAAEFDVDEPRNKGGLVLDCADYGVSETNADNTAQLRAAFADAKARKAAKLVLPRGRYALNGDAPLSLEGFADFTFDGGGSVFVSYRRKGAFMRLRRSVRTRFENFSLDWDWMREPLASIVRVKDVGIKSYDIEFVDYTDFPNTNTSLTVLSAYDPKTRSVGVEGGLTRYLDVDGGKPDRLTWIDGRTARVWDPPRGIAAGQLYRAQHFYYHCNGFHFEDVEHLQLRNVTVLSTPGHAFLIGGKSHHVSFNRVNILPPQNDLRRAITCTADHLHIAQSCGFIKLDGCEFSLGADDIVNMHDLTSFARKTGPRTVRAMNASAMAIARKGDRIELRNGDYSPTGFSGTLVDAKRVAEGGVRYDVTFAEDVPDETNGGFILFNRAFDTHNIIVRNCFFHDNRARGLLILARDVTVEENVFRHNESGAIKIETGYTLNRWSEGYGATNIVIRRNLFDNVNPSGSHARQRQRSIYAGVYMRTDPSPDVSVYPVLRDILVENNVFRDNTGVTAYLSNVSNAVIRGNVIDDPTARRSELPYRSQFYATHSQDVRIVGNIYRPSPNVKAPGVAFDSGSCRRIEAAGNRVEESAAGCGIKVATYNIRQSRCDANTPNAWERRRSGLVELLRRIDADVGGLQEVQPDQMEYLRKTLPAYWFAGEHRAADRVSDEASPVFYRKDRFLAEKSGTFWLSQTPDVPGSKSWGSAFPRVCSWVLLTDRRTGRSFCFANTHTDHASELARKEGMLLVAGRMGGFAPGGTPVVFVGDHNCTETEAPARAVSELLDNALYISETVPKGPWRTYTAWLYSDKEFSCAEALKMSEADRNAAVVCAGVRNYACGGPRIDYIYVSKGMRVLSYETRADTLDGSVRYPSDYFAAVAEIEFR